MSTIAVLDKANRLVGYKEKKKPSATDVVVPDDCDLPTDGTYYWNPEHGDGAFFPMGRGHGKPDRPPVSDHHVLYLVAKELQEDMPQEVKDWVTWYEENILPRSKP